MLRFRFALFTAAVLAAAPMFLDAQAPAAGAAPAPAATAKPANEKTTAVPFRVGTILAAELGKQKPTFDVESEFDQPTIDNPAWIEVVVKVENERSISRFDYELIGPNGNYSCFAVAENADNYSVDPDKWIIKKTHPLRMYRLLFPVKQTEFSSAKNGLLSVTLKLKLYDTTLPSSSLQACVLPDGVRFFSVSLIPGEGFCNMTYQDIQAARK